MRSPVSPKSWPAAIHPAPKVIAYLAGLHHSGLWRPSLIVCPATVLRQWLRELRAWYPPLRVVLLHDSGRGPPGTVRPGRSELLRRALQVCSSQGGGGAVRLSGLWRSRRPPLLVCLHIHLCIATIGDPCSIPPPEILPSPVP